MLQRKELQVPELQLLATEQNLQFNQGRVEIIELLKEIGVDYAQGFGVEKPVLIKEYAEKLS